MCGIAGILSENRMLVESGLIQEMTKALSHRGPDGEGFWKDEEMGIAFGHRRLAIIDKSSNGNQPFHYLHYVIVFNGEIYNYKELKKLLSEKGYSFHSETDTEVVPAAIDCWGKTALGMFDGMFSFALFNKSTKELLIARDRFGEKPLYYRAYFKERGRFERFFFASEIKALWAAGCEKKIQGTMMLNYLTLGMIHNPLNNNQTFYSDILSLPAGHFLSIYPNEMKINMEKWFYPDKWLSKSFQGEEGEAVELFKELLEISVERRLRSDVAVGTCLSGGLDSSAIVATILHSGKLGRVSCFSAFFEGFENNEEKYVRLVNKHYPQIELYSVRSKGDDLLNNIRSVAYHQEEPLQSSSVFSQWSVYKLAKEIGVTVLLDGQGADELLGGYEKYVMWHLHNLLRTDFPLFIKEKKAFSNNQFLQSWGMVNWGAAFFSTATFVMLQKKNVSLQMSHPFLNKDFLTAYINKDTLLKYGTLDLKSQLYQSTFHIGLEELLRYADRNSMAFSREVRLPFLSPELSEFIFSLPTNLLMKDGFTKWILRKAVSDILPVGIVWRKGKVGFEPPQQVWMEQPAFQRFIMGARSFLVEKKIFDPKCLQMPLRPKAAHSSGNYDWFTLSAALVLGY